MFVYPSSFSGEVVSFTLASAELVFIFWLLTEWNIAFSAIEQLLIEDVQNLRGLLVSQDFFPVVVSKGLFHRLPISIFVVVVVFVQW